jgi:hypothetical protein
MNLALSRCARASARSRVAPMRVFLRSPINSNAPSSLSMSPKAIPGPQSSSALPVCRRVGTRSLARFETAHACWSAPLSPELTAPSTASSALLRLSNRNAEYRRRASSARARALSCSTTCAWGPGDAPPALRDYPPNWFRDEPRSNKNPRVQRRWADPGVGTHPTAGDLYYCAYPGFAGGAPVLSSSRLSSAQWPRQVSRWSRPWSRSLPGPQAPRMASRPRRGRRSGGARSGRSPSRIPKRRRSS